MIKTELDWIIPVEAPTPSPLYENLAKQNGFVSSFQAAVNSHRYEVTWKTA